MKNIKTNNSTLIVKGTNKDVLQITSRIAADNPGLTIKQFVMKYTSQLNNYNSEVLVLV